MTPQTLTSPGTPCTRRRSGHVPEMARGLGVSPYTFPARHERHTAEPQNAGSRSDHGAHRSSSAQGCPGCGSEALSRSSPRSPGWASTWLAARGPGEPGPAARRQAGRCALEGQTAHASSKPLTPDPGPRSGCPAAPRRGTRCPSDRSLGEASREAGRLPSPGCWRCPRPKPRLSGLKPSAP